LTRGTVSGDWDVLEAVDLGPDVAGRAFTEGQFLVHGGGHGVDIGVDHGEGEGDCHHGDKGECHGGIGNEVVGLDSAFVVHGDTLA